MAMKTLAILALIALSISIKSGHAQDEALNLIQQDIAKATGVLNHATALFDKAADRGLYERYGTCIEEYRAAVFRTLPAAATEVKSGAYKAAVDDLKATAQHADNCENQFVGTIVSPFTAETKAVKDLAFRAIGVVQKRQSIPL